MTKPSKSLIALLLIISLEGLADARAQITESQYSNPVLGFQYTPPSGLLDGTNRAKALLKRPDASRQKSAQEQVLLVMFSGLDNTATEWHSLSIVTLPRSAFPRVSDIEAESKMNAFVAHSQNAGIYPRAVRVSGQDFAVSVFGMQQGNAKQGAVVWTTVRKGKLLSFAFVANSPMTLQELTKTMKSVQFF